MTLHMTMFLRTMPAAMAALGGVLTACPVQAAGSGDQGEAMSHVRVELGLDRSAVGPGGSATIGVRFIINEGWHLYWRNNGDSGMPIGVTFEAPEGVHVGEVRWPAPVRHIYGNGSVDYIYEHETALLAPIEIDDRFKAGDRVEITASFELLACREACVFGTGERTVVIDIAESTAMREPGWMKKFRDRIPRRIDLGDHLRWDGTDLLISVYGGSRIDGLTFYPFAPMEPAPIDPLRDGTSETDRLRIAYPPQIIGAQRVAGVVEIRARLSDSPAWIEIETTPPRAPTGADAANEPTPAHEQPQPTKDRSGD